MSDLLSILVGDCMERLLEVPAKSVQMCVTSPPYWNLRNYGMAGQLGMEKTPEKYVENLVAVFREVGRTLADDGTLWLNLGDGYAGGRGEGSITAKQKTNGGSLGFGPQKAPPGFKPKDLIGIPWMVAFALRADGWYLREDIIWHKPNPMPESIKDRCTRAHEYIFHLSKSRTYYHDAEAIKEPPSPAMVKQVEDGYRGAAVKDYLSAGVKDAAATKHNIIAKARQRIDKQRGHGRRHEGFNQKWDALTPAEQNLLGSNKRSVWTIAPANYREAHFATYPPALITPCILAGSRPGDMVLDPFGGSGTTGMVAIQLGRRATLIELNPAYAELCRQRCSTTPGLALTP